MKNRGRLFINNTNVHLQNQIELRLGSKHCVSLQYEDLEQILKIVTPWIFIDFLCIILDKIFLWSENFTICPKTLKRRYNFYQKSRKTLACRGVEKKDPYSSEDVPNQI